jgi:ADP-heptose:LPS heptosyltransferase
MRQLQYPKHKIILSRILEWLVYPFTLLIRKNCLSDDNVLKILIIEPFNIGDAVSISIMLDPLSEKYPNASIHLLINTTCCDLYKNDKRVAKVHGFESPWSTRGKHIKWSDCIKYIWRLHHEHFDIGIDVRGEIRNQLLMVALGCRARAGYTNYLCSNMVIRGLLLTHNAGNIRDKQRPLLNLDVIRTLGCNIDGRKASLNIPLHLGAEGNLRILCHVGAGWRYRLWSAIRWAELIERISKDYCISIHLICAESEKDILDDVLTALENDHTEVTATIIPHSDLLQLIAEIQDSRLFICLDSGPMHIAAALGKKVIALFGPGNIRLWKPISNHAWIIEHQEHFSCAPCLQSTCVSPNDNCMDAILVDEVYAAVRDALA